MTFILLVIIFHHDDYDQYSFGSASTNIPHNMFEPTGPSRTSSATNMLRPDLVGSGHVLSSRLSSLLASGESCENVPSRASIRCSVLLSDIQPSGGGRPPAFADTRLVRARRGRRRRRRRPCASVQTPQDAFFYYQNHTLVNRIRRC